MKMSGKDVATLLLVFGVGAYSFYGNETGTGPVGWLNYAQQAIFGHYDAEFSYILLLCLAGVLAAIASFVWKKVSGSKDNAEQSIGSRILFGPKATSSAPTVSQNPVTKLATQRKVLLQAGIVVVVIIWTMTFGIYWWYSSEMSEDAGAHYEPIEINDDAPMRQPQGSHVALRGGVPLDAALVHQSRSLGSTSEDYQLVPIALRSWVEGQAVTFVVKIKDLSELHSPSPIDPSANGNPATADILMARINGPVPGPVVLEFKKIGILLRDHNYLLRPVKMRDNKIIARPSIEEAFTFFLAFSGLVTVAVCAMGGLVLFIRIRAARKGLP